MTLKMDDRGIIAAYKVVLDPFDSDVGPYYSAVAEPPLAIEYRIGASVSAEYPIFLFYSKHAAQEFSRRLQAPSAILRCRVADVLPTTPKEVLSSAGDGNMDDVKYYWGCYFEGSTMYPALGELDAIRTPPSTILARSVTPVKKIMHIP